MKTRRYTPRKRSLVLYIVLLAAVIVAMLCIRTCKPHGSPYGPQKQGASEGDTLDIALLYAPMSYYTYNDTLGGYCYDALRLASRISGTPIKLWPVVSLDEALDKLQKGDFDVIAPLPTDEQVRDKYDYTTDLYLDRQVLIQLKDKNGTAPLSSSLELANDTLHLAKGSPAIYRVHNLIQEIGDTIYTQTHDDLSEEYLFMKVADGKLKYAVVSDRIAQQMHAKYPNVDFSTPISFTQFQGGVIRAKDTDTKRKFDAMMDRYEKSDAAQGLKERYGLATNEQNKIN